MVRRILPKPEPENPSFLTVECPACHSKPESPCTQSTIIRRRSVTWFHLSRMTKVRFETMPDDKGFEEQDVFPVGDFTAWSTPDGMMSEVRDKVRKVVKRYRGESGWSNAARHAGDLNSGR